MDGIYGKIYLASEYDQFKLIKGNRKISTNLKLEQSIKKEGIIRPITVNSNMEILDGQHRYVIAKKYDLPLPYYVSSSKNIDDIIDLNNSSKKWSNEDYINKYKQDGLLDYKQLDNLIKEYPDIVFGDMIYAAQGYCGTERERHSFLENVKNGTFKFANYEEFVKCLKAYETFRKYTEVNKGKGVFLAFFDLYIVQKFDLDRFIERVNEKDVKNRLIGINNKQRILKIFVQAYNRGVEKIYTNDIDFEIKKDRSIIIKESKKEFLLYKGNNF